MLTDEQIHALVMKKYPKDPNERNCKTKRNELKQKREWYAEQLRANKIEHPTLN